MEQKQVKIKDRVCGIENELGVLFVFPDGKMVGSAYAEARDILIKRMKREAIRYGIIPLSQHRFIGVWFTNGGMVYIDGSHPEFASPECRRVKDAVAYNKAAEILACKIFAHSRDKNRIRIFKNNIGKKENREWQDGSLLSRFRTYGCHENYLLFRGELFSDNTLRVLMPFLGTRQMYDGAGWWTNPKKNEFVLSQRALFLEKDVAMGASSGERAIINTRDVSYAGGSLKRLHIILGDANMLEYALFLKLGTTGLVLSLFEADRLPKYILENPVETVQLLSRSRDFDKKILVVRKGSGARVQRMSPLTLHSELCELAEEHSNNARFESEESEHEARTSVSSWNETLAALARKDRKWPIGRIDYATKEYVAEDMILRNPRNLSPHTIRERVDILYHELGSGSIYEQLKSEGKVTRVVSDHEIARAVTFPPKDTRAYARGMVIVREMKKRKKHRRLNYVGWQSIKFFRSNESTKFQREFVFENPLESNPPWLKKFLDV